MPCPVPYCKKLIVSSQTNVTQTGLPGSYFMSHRYLKQHAPTNTPSLCCVRSERHLQLMAADFTRRNIANAVDKYNI